MSCIVIIIVLVIVIALAIFLYCKFTKKRLRFVGGYSSIIINRPRIKGGHEIESPFGTLHLDNYGKLKDKLKEAHPDWNHEQIDETATALVNSIMHLANDTYNDRHLLGEFIDRRLLELIN